ncbi:UNVERIFIED_CONTAM: hypothetical protein ABIC26_000354 [Paenibacillus sp. PvR008]
MQTIQGTALLLLVLFFFTLFSYKAPKGMKAMGALAGASCAAFLVKYIEKKMPAGFQNLQDGYWKAKPTIK